MSNRGRDDDIFTVDDFDEYPDLGGGEDIQVTTSVPQAPRNRRFLLYASLLLLLIIGGVVLIILFAIDQGRRNTELQQTRVAIEATNNEVYRQITLTVIAKSWTPTPSATPTNTPTPTPTPTYTPSPTETPSPTVTITPSPTEDPRAMTATALALLLTLPPDALTGTAQARLSTFVAQTLTAAAGTVATVPTLGGTQPTQEVAGATATPSGPVVIIPGVPNVTVLPPLTPGPGTVLPTLELGTPAPTALADTGFADALLGGEGTNSLAVIGLAALGLVAVIVAARRLRVRPAKPH
ncbi:MAG: hypothetical protein IT323_08480 [Anaerolineae bacterium]|nr:hypothetical protein [Anaerolineae bacterium]